MRDYCAGYLQLLFEGPCSPERHCACVLHWILHRRKIRKSPNQNAGTISKQQHRRAMSFERTWAFKKQLIVLMQKVIDNSHSRDIDKRNSSYQNRIQFLEDYFGPPTLPAISLFWSTNMADTTVICILYKTRLRLVICKLLSCPPNVPRESITRTTLQLNCRSDFVINLG